MGISKIRQLLGNIRGFSIMELMIAVTVLSVISVGLLELLSRTNSQQSHSNNLYNIDQVRRQFSVIIDNADHWDATVRANGGVATASLACLDASLGAAKPNCTHGASMPFVLYTRGGVKFFDPNTQGFKVDGQVCTLGTAKCSLKLALNVNVKCAPVGGSSTPPASCPSPSEILVSGDFSGASPAGVAAIGVFNAKNYAISVRKDDADAAGRGGTPLRLSCASVERISTSTAQICNTSPCAPPMCPTGYSSKGVSEEVVSMAIYQDTQAVAVCNLVRTCVADL